MEEKQEFRTETIYGKDVFIFDKKPELELIRKPILLTKKKGGYFYFNLYEGKGSFSIDDVVDDDNYQIIPKKGSFEYGVSIQPMKNINLVVFIFCKIDTRYLGNGVIRKWEPYDYAFIDDKKRLFVHENFYHEGSYISLLKNGYVETEWNWNLESLHHCNLLKRCTIINSKEIISDSEGNEIWYQYDVLKPLHAMFGEIVTIDGNKMICLDSLDSFGIFMKYKSPKNSKENKNTRKLDQLLKYELAPVSVPENFKDVNVRFGYEHRTYNPCNENVQKFAIIQRVDGADEPTCVLRSFFKSPYSEYFREGGRIYVTKNEIISSRTLDDGSFMYQKLLEKPNNWNFSIEAFETNVAKGTWLEYFGEIINEIDYEDRGLAIWSFLKYPMTEQLFKLPELTDIMKVIFKLSVKKSPMEILSEIFFAENKEETNAYRFLGLNRYQLPKLVAMLKSYFPIFNIHVWTRFSSVVKDFKFLVGDNPNSADNATTDWALNLISDFLEAKKEACSNNFVKIDDAVEVSKLTYQQFCARFKGFCWEDSLADFVTILNRLKSVYSLTTAKKMAPIVMENIDKEFVVQYRNFFGDDDHRTVVFRRCFLDFIEMVEDCNMASSVKPYFSSAEELSSMHDTMVDYINAKEDEIQLQNWNSRKNSWNKYKYSNKTFSIVVPNSPDELATEGITLHHCVKSYIKKVANGVTNIVFVRKNDELEKPFYTIEIDNDDIVQQVHGVCNSNATLEVKEFVDEWVKNKHFSLSNIDKVR